MCVCVVVEYVWGAGDAEERDTRGTRWNVFGEGRDLFLVKEAFSGRRIKCVKLTRRGSVRARENYTGQV